MSALVETMFYVGSVPWHGQGTKLDQPPTSQEAMIASGLDWEVEARPVFDFQFREDEMNIGDIKISGGNYSPIDMEQVPGVQAIRRNTDGKFLGVVGDVWTPVQNREAFGWFDPMVQDGLATYHTAGSLRGGEMVWILAQVGSEANIIGNDNVSQFLLLSMGHGCAGINILPTTIRVVCANTLSWAESKGNNVTAKFVHKGNVVERMDDFRDVLRVFIHDFDQTNEVFKLLAGKEINTSQVDEYLNKVFPPRTGEDGRPLELTAHGRKLREKLIAKFEGDLLGYNLIPSDKRKTLWTIYNAVTEYTDHERGQDAHRLQNAWLGEGSRIKKVALEAAKVLI